ncbi:Subtilisin-like protease [Acorus calamus]|uniref:Subtilisin-like protease n=1 Tax=Acorus calamus TaxID=4465 RepID=A0AAV9DZ96_ACOCL|nr:Subtilisin-like protease [Acorus calamus]
MATQFTLRPYLLLLVFQLFLASLSSADEAKKLYIVYMGERQSKDPKRVTASHHDILTSILGSKEKALDSMMYSYKHGFSGFSAMLTDSQAKQIAGLPDVIQVKLSKTFHVQTTRSWDFLGLNYNHPTELLKGSNGGEGIIVGVMDSGLWPESKSFNDDGYGPIPSRWKGKCQAGQSFNASNCNRKIIGARYYTRGIDPNDLKGDYKSPRGRNGHGTHTSSTVAGSLVKNAGFQGLAPGIARGGAPRARLAMYKVCWGDGGACSDASLLAAFDDAIHDGVDILSLSLGSSENSFGSLHAAAKGITIVYAAGNDGPTPQTVGDTAPWVISVAASTIDRSFPTVITLGNNRSFVGQGMVYGSTYANTFNELHWGVSCEMDDLDDAKGKFVLCSKLEEPLTITFGDALSNVIQAGGKGIIYTQSVDDLLYEVLSCKGQSCVMVDTEIAKQILIYLDEKSTSSDSRHPIAKVSDTRYVEGTEVWAPRVAAFSSRGPSTEFPGILKPDVAAPGVNILAAIKDSYAFDSGTSMACPHVSGIVALLKSLHPYWSSAAIKSALVTTANVYDKFGVPIVAEGKTRKIADPFDFGGGHVDPNRAADPGLIYDVAMADYVKFFKCKVVVLPDCASLPLRAYDLNLPSIAVPDLKTSVTVWRTVTNVGPENSVYKAVIEPPPGIKMEVEPSVLTFNAKTKTQGFRVTFTSVRKVQGVYTFGSLTWYDGLHRVRSPIAVRTVIEDFFADVA